MAIVQDAYDLTDDILTKILTGEYRRIGSVVRYATGPNKGQIVKHLKPINVQNAEQAQNVGAKLIKFAKNNKKALIVGSIIAGAVAGGTAIYYNVKKREPEVVTKFRAALKAYIEAIRKGTLEIEIIDTLMSCLEEINKHKDCEKIKIQLSTEEIGVLINRIHEYTDKLAKDNAIELTENESRITSCASGDILDLQDYLKVQRRIFEAA